MDERGRGARTGESARRLEQWDRYWAYGNIHSFSQVSGGNYQGAIADFWKSRFETLESESRILDIATGNGAIALLALESSDQRSAHFEILGVDLADIDPSRQVKDPSLAGKIESNQVSEPRFRRVAASRQRQHRHGLQSIRYRVQ